MSDLKHLFGLVPLIQSQCPEGLDHFIETGCGAGDGIVWALEQDFDTIASCDTDRKLVRACNNFLSERDLDVVVHQSSLDFLKQLTLIGPSLIWLDTHDTAQYVFPIWKELRVLQMKGVLYERSIVLIDDVDVMPGCPFKHHRTLKSPLFTDVKRRLWETHNIGWLIDTITMRPVLVGTPKPLVTKQKGMG